MTGVTVIRLQHVQWLGMSGLIKVMVKVMGEASLVQTECSHAAIGASSLFQVWSQLWHTHTSAEKRARGEQWSETGECE